MDDVGEDNLMERGESRPISHGSDIVAQLQKLSAATIAADSELTEKHPQHDNSRVHVFKNQGKYLRNKFRASRREKNKPRRSKIRKLEKCPKGYPRLAAFLDIDENFMLYRRFGFLQARVLLYKQDELREMEDRLDRLDKDDEEDRPKMLRSREDDNADDEYRMKLMQEIEEKFSEYAKLLTLARDLAAFSRPPSRDYFSIRTYFDSQDPLCNEESYIYHKEDIVSLKPGREHSWLDSFVESILRQLKWKIVRYLFTSPELREKADPKVSQVWLLKRERIEMLVSLIITIVIVAILVVPIYILFDLTVGPQTGHSIAIIIGILLVFTLLFSGILSLFTRAKRHEILAAAAAYCAVLVVFIGNVNKMSP